jgi:hypothetical protein
VLSPADTDVFQKTEIHPDQEAASAALATLAENTVLLPALLHGNQACPSERIAADHQQNLEVRSHVLTLREGELDSRLRDSDRTIEDLNLRLRELTRLLRKEQATRELLSRNQPRNEVRIGIRTFATQRAAEDWITQADAWGLLR